MRNRILAVGALAAVLIVAGTFVGLAGSASHVAPRNPTPAPMEITIDNFTFSRQEVTVPRGTQITWVNRDDMAHTVTSSDKTFHSPALDTGDRFSHTFDTPGTYEYFCSLHPRMTGRVVVR